MRGAFTGSITGITANVFKNGPLIHNGENNAIRQELGTAGNCQREPAGTRPGISTGKPSTMRGSNTGTLLREEGMLPGKRPHIRLPGVL